ncbi:PREDICTED: transmembrane protein 89, partial [Myotis davidii]|uniref:transmembrane protein 89 n=1 Tax=Myotis davidii TaxID=225400 RepID=UPI0007677E5B
LVLLLAMSAPSQAWSRPLWYQVGLDLQPWGCQPSSLDGCGVSLGCPGQWLGLGMNPIYSVTGVMLTSAMMLMVGRKVLQRPQGPHGHSRPQTLRHPAPPSPAHRPSPTPRGALRRAPVHPSALTLPLGPTQLLQVPAHTPGLSKRRTPISDHALLVTVLHMLDALLAQIQSHLQHLAAQQPRQIKGTPTPCG